jgi:hypothetical protein
MSRRVVVLLTAALASSIVGVVGCSDALPLGGPHGGEGPDIAPTAGSYANGSTYTPPEPPPPPAGGDPGTWNHIFSSYFEKGTVGDCPLCHSEMKTARSSYSWMRDLEYIGDSPTPLVDSGRSCLSWFGGSMPPGLVPPNDVAIAELNTWATAGAKNN